MPVFHFKLPAWHLLLNVQPTHNMFLTEFIFSLPKSIPSTTSSISAHHFHNHFRGKETSVNCHYSKPYDYLQIFYLLSLFVDYTYLSHWLLALAMWCVLANGIWTYMGYARTFKGQCKFLLPLLPFPSVLRKDIPNRGCFFSLGLVIRKQIKSSHSR